MSGQDIKTMDIMAHHLEDMMSDCDLYRREKVRGFQGVLLNQIEQGHLSWADQILKFRRALVGHSPSPPPKPPQPHQPCLTCRQGRRYHQTVGEYNAPARLCLMPCDTFNPKKKCAKEVAT